ncbi:MAG: hypothetical protein GXO37_07945, partial [Chloroflexi bacterium]|nr:hypothetical protein [Chloroflexota bacterium]
LRAAVGEAAFAALLDAGALVRLSPQVVVPRGRFADWLARLRQAFPHQPFTVAQARAVLGVSRRYALALLEHLDAQGLTRREGEARVWTSAPDQPAAAQR